MFIDALAYFEISSNVNEEWDFCFSRLELKGWESLIYKVYLSQIISKGRLILDYAVVVEDKD